MNVKDQQGIIPPPVGGQSSAWPQKLRCKRCWRAGRKAGFTLVEAVVAAALLILALSAFVVSFVQSKRSAAIADNNLEAIHIARQQMETLCSSNYSGLIIGPHSFTNGIYTGTYTVTSNTVARVKDIALTVKWVNAAGKITSTVSLAGSLSSELHQ